MTPSDHWKLVRRLFEEASGLDYSDRRRFLESACEDESVRNEVWELLEASDPARLGPLDHPVFDLPTESEDIDPITDEPIGPYQVTRILGRGGMGTVYLSERRDGSYEKTVALKVIRRGLDTEDILSRFRYERQILASLDHPNIASLLDGGVTSDGRPWFAMEYVEGVPVTEYCDREKLTAIQRLGLFRTICRTVEYAHRNLVIHRDLKPSNILVAADGTVKLLDFGIAKLLSDEGIEASAPLTFTGRRMMTPEYASPEQVRGDSITTSTDVYQLGVLLYELLTGERPYRIANRVRSSIERAILDTQPVRPSTLVRDAATTGDGADRESNRSTKSGELARLLAGDMDSICLTALRKEPERRYASAEQFGEDIARFLDGRPVSARADSVPYRTSKFVRRNRTGVATTLLILAVVLAGSVMYTVRVRAERDRAERALRQSDRSMEFLRNVLLAGDPVEGDPDAPVGVVLDSAAARLDRLDDEPEVERTVRAALGYVYSSMGRLSEGERHLRAADSLVSDETEPRHEASNLVTLAALLGDTGRYDEGLALNGRALGILESSDINGAVRAAALDGHGSLLYNSGREEESISWYQDALSQYRLADHPDSAITLNNLAVAYAVLGRSDEALRLQRSVVAAHEANGDPATRVGISLAVLASMYGNAGMPDSSIATHRRAVSLLRGELGEDHLDTITARVSLALQLFRTQQHDEALAEAEPALDAALDGLGPDSPFTAYAQEVTGAIQCDAGRPLEGAENVRAARQTRSAFLPDNHALILNGTSLLGGCLFAAGDIVEAEPLLVDAYQQLLETVGEDHPYTVRARTRLVGLYNETNRDDLAIRIGESSGT